MVRGSSAKIKRGSRQYAHLRVDVASAQEKGKTGRQARHQADNLAKLRFEFLSVLELIAQILCAVAVQKSSEALGNTHTCVLMLPQRRFLHKIAILRAESKLRKTQLYVIRDA